jgi:ribosomal protein L11 methyltransferase
MSRPTEVPETEPRFPQVTVEVPSDDADEAGALLFELGARGVEHRDATTLVRGTGGRTTLVASFSSPDEARSAVGELPVGWSPRFVEVVGDAWRDEWKKYFEPFRICDGVIVCPPWRTAVDRPGERDERGEVDEPRNAEQPAGVTVVLEPGRAFGTGLHESTRLIAELLAAEREALPETRVLDVGCGSGVLALVALALGASSARAVDIDPDAVAVTRENAARNGMQRRLEADDAPLRSLGEFPLVVANIDCATLVELAPDLCSRLKRGGRLLLSGVLAPEVAPEQLTAVTAAYARLRREEVRRAGEWIAIAFRA